MLQAAWQIDGLRTSVNSRWTWLKEPKKRRWRTGGHANLEKRSSCEGGWLDLGGKEFYLIYFGLRYVPGNEWRHQSHRDSKKPFSCEFLMLMMFEPSIIFNTMNAKSGGEPLHILLTLKITLRVQNCGYLWVLCPQTSLYSRDVDAFTQLHKLT